MSFYHLSLKNILRNIRPTLTCHCFKTSFRHHLLICRSANMFVIGQPSQSHLVTSFFCFDSPHFLFHLEILLKHQTCVNWPMCKSLFPWSSVHRHSENIFIISQTTQSQLVTSFCFYDPHLICHLETHLTSIWPALTFQYFDNSFLDLLFICCSEHLIVIGQPS